MVIYCLDKSIFLQLCLCIIKLIYYVVLSVYIVLNLKFNLALIPHVNRIGGKNYTTINFNRIKFNNNNVILLLESV